MKVVHCSTSVSESSACMRLHKALLKQNVDSQILVLYKNIENVSQVHEIAEYGITYKIYKHMAYYINIAEDIFMKNFLGLQEGMPFTFGCFGVDITQLEIIKTADVIHIHCTNGQFLSLYSIKQLLKTNKKIVITLHDSWNLTGGCHVLCGCEKFGDNCYKCSEIRRGFGLISLIFKRKEKLYSFYHNFILTAPGKWTAGNVYKSRIFREKKAYVIGNTLDFEIFKRKHNNAVSQNMGLTANNQKIRILFGAMNCMETPYKGYKYLKKSLIYLKEKYPDFASKIELNIFGTSECDKDIDSLFSCRLWGNIKEQETMARLYTFCDIYVVPSLEDSFNQTVLESCACKTPAVSFRTGGIVDIIDHKKNGYLAEYANYQDLAEGIMWVYDHNRNNCIGELACSSVSEKFSEKKIAHEFIRIYENGKVGENEKKR